MDSLHLSDLLPNPVVRNGQIRGCWSIILATCHSCFQQGNNYGVGYESHHYIRHDYATFGRSQNHWRQHVEQRGQRALPGILETFRPSHYFRWSTCLSSIRHVRTSRRTWTYQIRFDHWTTFPCWIHGSHARWAPPKGLWTWIRNFTLYRHQHLRDHPLEIILPSHH